MSHKLSKRSLDRLKGIDQVLIDIITEGIKDSPIDGWDWYDESPIPETTTSAETLDALKELTKGMTKEEIEQTLNS